MTIGWLLALAWTSLACAADNDKVSEVRKVKPFSSIEMTSVATVYFTQGKECSLKIEGKERFVRNIETNVKDDCLVIGFVNKKDSYKRKDGVDIYLTAPDLKRVEVTGVGGFNCKEPLKLEDVVLEVSGVGEVNIADLACQRLKVKLEGVGDVDIHVDCDYLHARLTGVGSVNLSGSAKDADISKGGIGSVDTKGLRIGK